MTAETTITSCPDPLPLMEAFYTIQGEGFHQGKAAYFIRLGGCDVGCVWCDVKESWDASAHPLQTVSEMVRQAKKFPGKNCCCYRRGAADARLSRHLPVNYMKPVFKRISKLPALIRSAANGTGYAFHQKNSNNLSRSDRTGR